LTLTAKDIVDNSVSQTWMKKIDRSKPKDIPTTRPERL
jgi:hypothetical protein